MVKIEHLSKKFGKKQALKDINYQFDKGVYGLLGPNGAGKTTLIRCILDLYNFKQGEVIVETDKDEQFLIGYLPQKSGVISGLTVEEQLMYFANLKDMDKKIWDEEITRVLELVNLTDVRKVKGRKLSGGMVRRVGIAQALLNHPVLIIFDEPTTGLDPEERVRFKNIVQQIGKESIVIMSTHIVEDVEAVCDKVLIMKEGRIVADGTQEEISHYATGKVYELPKDMCTEDDFIEKEKEVDGEIKMRILTNRKIDGGVEAVPNVEDGYLCVLKDIS